MPGTVAGFPANENPLLALEAGSNFGHGNRSTSTRRAGKRKQMSKNSGNKLDQLVAETRRQQDERAQTYRGLALKLFPWICGRCGREFTHTNLRELTVHHKNHDHDDNPADGSNWELLCLYCHDNEHQRQLEIHGVGTGGNDTNHKSSTRKPFANLKDLLNKN